MTSGLGTTNWNHFPSLPYPFGHIPDASIVFARNKIQPLFDVIDINNWIAFQQVE
jgi:hypothetical protein